MLHCFDTDDPGCFLQDERVDKERARIEAMRARAQARTARFMDSRLRTMGVDKDYLDRQVHEKQEAMRLERETYMQEGMIAIIALIF